MDKQNTRNRTTKKKKKRKKKRYLLKFTLLVLILTGLYQFLSSSLFDVQQITVVDNSYFTPEQIIELAEARTGENLFVADTGAMKDKLLAEPYIKNVKIQRKLPGTIVITLEERREAAAVPNGGKFLLIDPDGMILRETGSEPALTIIHGLTLSSRTPGTPLSAEENALLADALTMLKAVEESELFFKSMEISTVIIKAHVYDFLTVEGTPENIRNNIQALKDVLADLYKKGIERGVIIIGSEGYVSFNPMLE